MFHKSIQLGLCLSLLSLPVIEQINNPVRAQSVPDRNSYQANSVLPRNTSILITVPYTIGIDVKAKETLPTVAVLSAPLYDRHGRQLAPQGSTVTITLKSSSSKTGKIYADSIIAGPINIPIKASSAEISGRKITLEKNNQRKKENVQLGHDFGNVLGYAITPSSKFNAHTSAQYHAIGGLVGGLIDLAAGDETRRILELKAGHTLALKLEEDAIFYSPTNYSPRFTPDFHNPIYSSTRTSQVQTQDNSPSSNLPYLNQDVKYRPGNYSLTVDGL